MDYDDEEPVRPRRKSNTGLIIGLVGGFIVLALLCCGGLAYFGFKTITKDLPDLQNTINTFLDHVQASNIPLARQQLTQNSQKSLSEEQLTALIARNPIMSKHVSRSMGGFNLQNNNLRKTATLQYQLTDDAGQSQSVTFHLIVENDTWKIDRFGP